MWQAIATHRSSSFQAFKPSIWHLLHWSLWKSLRMFSWREELVAGNLIWVLMTGRYNKMLERVNVLSSTKQPPDVVSLAQLKWLMTERRGYQISPRYLCTASLLTPFQTFPERDWFVALLQKGLDKLLIKGSCITTRTSMSVSRRTTFLHHTLSILWL